MIGLGFCGGIAGTRRFIAECEDAGVGFWFYSGDLGIATAAYLHIAAATPYLDRPSQSLLRWTTDDVIVGGPFSPESGVVPVPTAPGLGVELDEDAVARGVERFSRQGRTTSTRGRRSRAIDAGLRRKISLAPSSADRETTETCVQGVRYHVAAPQQSCLLT